MLEHMRPDEMRVVIRPYDALAGDTRPIPAAVFKRTFTSILDALKAADAEIHSRKRRSEFFISHLAMGSNEFGVFEQKRAADASPSPSIDLLKSGLSAVYHSDYSKISGMNRLIKSIIKVGDAINPKYPSSTFFQQEAIPLDSFFSRQTARLKFEGRSAGVACQNFVGNAIVSFDGRLGSIDYRGATWTGHLMLPGSGAQVECVFDRRRGEDAYNPFGNKRVSVTGRAIYTGDSALPERIEVRSIEEIPVAQHAIDIKGSLTGRHYFSGWGRRA